MINLKNIPQKPGCYLYFNKDNVVIYVGKAKNLKKRVSSYFIKSQNFKTEKLISEIEKVETIITNNEKESLLLEQNLIKKYSPRFNVLLNDDKRYPYIAITNEKDPKYVYIRKNNHKYKNVFGPFPSGSNARQILETLETLIPLRRCKGNLGKPCLYFQIDECSGACFKDVSEDYYKEQIKKIKNFFKGDTEFVKKRLFEKISVSANNLQFEQAKRYKEILDHIDFLVGTQNVELQEKINRHVINFYQDENNICISVLFYLNGKLSFKEQEIFPNNFQSLEETLESFIFQFYEKNTQPDLLNLPEQFNNLYVLEELKLKFDNKTKISKKLLDLCKENSKEFLYSKKTINDSYDVLLDMQKSFDLNKYPNHIEVFDIANIGKEFVTGGVVVFKNGKPIKNEFRAYKIEIEQGDDFHRMQNVIYRRYQKSLMEKRILPDLIIVDGGKIQFNAAMSQLNELNLNINVIGLVKNNKHKTEKGINYLGHEVDIKKNKRLFNFLAAMQERVHEYTISVFRFKKESAIKKDMLYEVKGLGPKQILKIRNKFPDNNSLFSANIDLIKEMITNKNTLDNLIEFIKRNK
ncbi:excinuclease ABC subunit UvrC [Spiroplasma endosymbiont of Crioceris asparagi]|uniref:excinuclease ABC subunit UvrC n=1 Tax=Spiroplasma endosymbiont of Crioceris asparagi TaxID=3066286 RepID=UPI0030D573E6